MIDFYNTEIAFSAKSNQSLQNAKFLYSLIQYPALVSSLGGLSKFCLKLHLPVAWVIKPTLYKLFVGGETIEETLLVAEKLFKHGVYSLLDFSVEAATNEKEIELTMNELIKSIKTSGLYDFIPYSVFKPTAIVIPAVLRKVSENKPLDASEQRDFNKFKERFELLCIEADKAGKPIMVDAEDYWYQKAIDDVTELMMEKYNKGKVVVFTTLQMYRHDRMSYLLQLFENAKSKGYKLGLKFVRGAYTEKERLRAKQGGYPSPICNTKQETDDNFNKAMEVSLENIDNCEIFCGTHNEESCVLAVKKMEQLGLANNDRRILFSQLYGMSDNLSFNLSHAGYNVAKYIPYGKIKNVLPYLLRRARENTAIAGQTTRELNFLKIESKRRKKRK